MKKTVIKTKSDRKNKISPIGYVPVSNFARLSVSDRIAPALTKAAIPLN